MSGDSEKVDFLIESNGEHHGPDSDTSDDESWIYDQLSECDGFDVDPVHGGLSGGIIYPLDIDHNPERLLKCINLAIEEYCKKNDGKKLKLKKSLKWNAKFVRGFEYYITFTAEDEETHEVETFQAIVWNTIEDTYVEMVKVKPKKRLPDAYSLEGRNTKKPKIDVIV